MIIYLSNDNLSVRGTQTTQSTQMNADFFFCHVELVETSHVTYMKKYYMRPFDYAQGDRYICGHLVKSVSSVCHLKFPFIV